MSIAAREVDMLSDAVIDLVNKATADAKGDDFQALSNLLIAVMIAGHSLQAKPENLAANIVALFPAVAANLEQMKRDLAGEPQ